MSHLDAPMEEQLESTWLQPCDLCQIGNVLVSPSQFLLLLSGTACSGIRGGAAIVAMATAMHVCSAPSTGLVRDITQLSHCSCCPAQGIKQGTEHSSPSSCYSFRDWDRSSSMPLTSLTCTAEQTM